MFSNLQSQCFSLCFLFPQMVGAFWYLLAVERKDDCWHSACHSNNSICQPDYLYCGNSGLQGYDNWNKSSETVLQTNCAADGDNPPFNYGIYSNALKSGIVSSKKFISKYCYSMWWGLQNLRCTSLLFYLVLGNQ